MVQGLGVLGFESGLYSGIFRCGVRDRASDIGQKHVCPNSGGKRSRRLSVFMAVYTGFQHLLDSTLIWGKIDMLSCLYEIQDMHLVSCVADNVQVASVRWKVVDRVQLGGSFFAWAVSVAGSPANRYHFTSAGMGRKTCNGIQSLKVTWPSCALRKRVRASPA